MNGLLNTSKVLFLVFVILLFVDFGFAFSLSANETYFDTGGYKYGLCTGSASIAGAVSAFVTGTNAEAANINHSYPVAPIASSYFSSYCFTPTEIACYSPNISSVATSDSGTATNNSYAAGTGLQNAYIAFMYSSKHTNHETGVLADSPNYYSIGSGELMASGEVASIGSGSTVTISASGGMSPFINNESTGLGPPSLLRTGFGWSTSFDISGGAIGPNPIAWSYGQTSGGANSSYAEMKMGPDNTTQVPIYPISLAYIYDGSAYNYIGAVASTCGSPLYYKSARWGLFAGSTTSTGIGTRFDPVNPDGSCARSISQYTTQYSLSGAGGEVPASINSRAINCYPGTSDPIDLCSIEGVPPTQENLAGLNELIASYPNLVKIVTYNPVERAPPVFSWPNYDDGYVYGNLFDWASSVYITYELASICGSPGVTPGNFPNSPKNIPGEGPGVIPIGPDGLPTEVPGGNLPVINNKPFRCEVSASPNPQTVNGLVQWKVEIFDSAGNVVSWTPTDLSYVWTGSEGLTGTSSQVNKSYVNAGQQYAQAEITSNSGAFFQLICSNTEDIQTPLSVTCVGSLPYGNLLDSENGSTVTWNAFPRGGDFSSSQYGYSNYNYSWNLNPEPELGFWDDTISQISSFYNTTGNKTASVTVTDPAGNNASATCSTALINFSVTCFPDQVSYATSENVNWRATVSPTIPSQNYTFRWSGENIDNRTGALVTTSYSTPGAKSATVTVTTTINGTSVSQVFNCSSTIITQTPPQPSCTITPNHDSVLTGSDLNMIISTQNFVNPIITTIANCGDSAILQNQNNCNGLLNSSCTFTCRNYLNATASSIIVNPTVTLSNGSGESATCSTNATILNQAPPSQPPICVISATTPNPQVNPIVTFRINPIIDPMNQQAIISGTIDYNNGTHLSIPLDVIQPTLISYTYTTTNTFYPTLTITGQGGVGICSTTIIINPTESTVTPNGTGDNLVTISIDTVPTSKTNYYKNSSPTDFVELAITVKRKSGSSVNSVKFNLTRVNQVVGATATELISTPYTVTFPTGQNEVTFNSATITALKDTVDDKAYGVYTYTAMVPSNQILSDTGTRLIDAKTRDNSASVSITIYPSSESIPDLNPILSIIIALAVITILIGTKKH